MRISCLHRVRLVKRSSGVAMFFLLLFGVLVCLCQGFYIVTPGAKYPPSKGEIWPRPQNENKLETFYTFNPSQFDFKVTSETCKILTDALKRYVYVFKKDRATARRRRRSQGRKLRKTSHKNHVGLLRELKVELKRPCEDYPYFNMSEHYSLNIAGSYSSSLVSTSIWGILLGLESFAQSFYFSDDFNEVRINRTTIDDWPRYPHRGLLLDTGRHFISMKNIRHTLDAMNINKMNVFHWHIIDDQSFPYQSEILPKLSEKGAFHVSALYTKNDVETVINYARDRGIRVIPEFDVPGHTASWGVAYPNVLTKCYVGKDVVGLGPMDPTNKATYQLIKSLFEEVNQLFPDKYFHVGGDEVDLNCWSSNPDLEQYMREHDLKSPTELHALFMKLAVKLVDSKKNIIVWEEVFAENVPLSNDTIIHVWKHTPVATMTKAITSGHRVIFSSSWYLDQRNNLGTWQEMYEDDPREMLANSTLEAGIVGGEACMWGEMVDDNNVINRVWPRACAVAERLWSNTVGTPLEAVHRIEEQTCRLKRRGIKAQPPNGPSYCPS